MTNPVAKTTSPGGIRVQKLTCTIGAELSNVSLADAGRDADLFAEVKALLLQHKVLFLRDQHISPAEHVAFARRFGELENHPVLGSDPDNPGLVQFKQRWGTTQTDMPYYFDPPGEGMSVVKSDSLKYRLFTGAFRRMPPALAIRVGERIFRHFG